MKKRQKQGAEIIGDWEACMNRQQDSIWNSRDMKL